MVKRRTWSGAIVPLTLGLVALGGALLLAQQPVFRTEVRLVQIEVRVTERDGTPVEDLTAADFVLTEDDRPQEIAALSFVAGSPAAASRDERGDRDSIIVPPQTWVYIATEVAPTEFTRTYGAIRRFVAEQLEPGVAVSLGGLPFMSDPSRLLAVLDLMRDGPYGGDGRPAVVDPALVHFEDVALLRQVADAQRHEAPSPEGPIALGPEPWFDRSPLGVHRLDRQIALFGQAALFRYLDLIERMAMYPGQKVIVLFRPGLRLDRDSQSLLSQLAAAALRHRVGFYTADSRGLDPQILEDDAMRLPAGFQRRRREVDITARQAFQHEMRDGLVTLADETGGAALLNTNNMSAIFDTVIERAADYYVLSYYPAEAPGAGRFRRLRVRVNRPGVRVDTLRGYYEPAAGGRESKTDRAIALRRALEFDAAADFPVAATARLFAGPDGDPIALFSAGVRPAHLAAREGRREAAFDTTLLVRTTAAQGISLPLYHEQRLSHTLPLDRWRQARQQEEEATFLICNAVMPIAPGRYGMRIVVRDEHSGRLGSLEAPLDVPDFTQPSTPSSLLLTRDVIARPPARAGNGADEATDIAAVLDAGPLTFMPQPASIFRRGDLIHLLYHLYNPTPEDLASATLGMRIGVLKAGRPVEGVEVAGEPFVDPDRSVIRFTAAISTADLPAGDYMALVVLPNHRTREVPHLAELFTVVD